MPRPSVISYDDVARAFVRIIGKGRYPSIDALYEELGRRGSKGTIHKHQKAFLETFQEKGIAMLPAALPEALLPIIEDFWSQALVKAGEQYSDHEDRWRCEIDEYKERDESQKARIAELEHQLDERKKDLEHQYDEKVKAKNVATEAIRKIDQHELTIHGQQQEIRALNNRVESIQSDHATRLDEIRHEHQERVDALQGLLDEMTEKARRDEEAHTRLVDHWIRQVDDARLQMTELREEVRGEKERAAAEVNAERAKSARLSQQLDDARETLMARQEALDKALKDLAVQEREVGHRDERIVALEKDNASLEGDVSALREALKEQGEHVETLEKALAQASTNKKKGK